jgi:hypothetical protein
VLFIAVDTEDAERPTPPNMEKDNRHNGNSLPKGHVGKWPLPFDRHPFSAT